jgi:hypothetical protein
MVVVGDIYRRVRQYFSGHIHHFQNKFIFSRDWESDFFCVSNSGYCIEVEVKMSKSDFIADFKKEKHELFRKHLLGEATTRCLPNKFWFAAPKGALRILDIPKYAGLIEIEWREGESEPRMDITIRAPFIHKNKMDIKHVLFGKYYYGHISLQRENWELKRALKKLTELKEKV